MLQLVLEGRRFDLGHVLEGRLDLGLSDCVLGRRQSLPQPVELLTVILIRLVNCVQWELLRLYALVWSLREVIAPVFVGRLRGRAPCRCVC